VPEALLVIAFVGLMSSTVYLLLAAAATIRFRAADPARGAAVAVARDAPPVSVLKPVHGDELQLEESLESFFRQRYPAFEIVFGSRHQSDAAWDTINKLTLRYPHVPAKIVIAGDPIYPNAKVSTLEAIIREAAFSYLVIADSDARVGPDCLAEVTRPLHDPGIGLVTCLYRGVPTGGLSSRLEALGMSVEMASGVLVADMLEGMRFALGPTSATRAEVLRTIGGIGSLGDYCADDYLLGQRVHAAACDRARGGESFVPSVDCASAALESEHAVFAAMGSRRQRADVRDPLWHFRLCRSRVARTSVVGDRVGVRGDPEPRSAVPDRRLGRGARSRVFEVLLDLSAARSHRVPGVVRQLCRNRDRVAG
jgi:Glycosyl transferase family 21